MKPLLSLDCAGADVLRRVIAAVDRAGLPASTVRDVRKSLVRGHREVCRTCRPHVHRKGGKL